MEEFKILVSSAPPKGYCWQIQGPGQRTVKSGNATSEVEAKAAAEKALKELQG
jgi:hypothetical protein